MKNLTPHSTKQPTDWPTGVTVTMAIWILIIFIVAMALPEMKDFVFWSGILVLLLGILAAKRTWPPKEYNANWVLIIIATCLFIFAFARPYPGDQIQTLEWPSKGALVVDWILFYLSQTPPRIQQKNQ